LKITVIFIISSLYYSSTFLVLTAQNPHALKARPANLFGGTDHYPSEKGKKVSVCSV
jgi:hypothetical protein